MLPTVHERIAALKDKIARYQLTQAAVSQASGLTQATVSRTLRELHKRTSAETLTNLENGVAVLIRRRTRSRRARAA